MSDLAAALGGRFVERRDVFAKQFADGHYEPVRRPIKLGDLRKHLSGEQTIGHYLISQEDRCRLFAFDLDLNPKGFWISLDEGDDPLEPQNCNPREVWRTKGHPGRKFLALQLRSLADALGTRTRSLLDVPVAVAYSGSKGLHVYGFTGPVAAGDARQAALEVLNSFNRPPCKIVKIRGNNFFAVEHPANEQINVSIEIYPKQESLQDKDLGNLMRLPLGVHRKHGHPGFFVDMTQAMTTLKPVASPDAVLEHGQIW